MRAMPLVALLLPAMALAAWVDLGIEGTDHAVLEVVESTPTGMVVELTVPGIEMTEREEGGIDYTILGMPGATSTALDEGYPMFPKVSFLAALPESPSVTATVEAVSSTTVGAVTPWPMQPIQPDDAREPAPFTVVPSAYTSGRYPLDAVQHTVDGVLRGVTVGRFTLNPVGWDPVTGELTVASRMRVRIDFGGTATVEPRLYSRFWAPTFRQSILNAGVLGEPQRSMAARADGYIVARTMEEAVDIDGADLLVLAGDDFVDTMMDDFLTAKHEQGYLTAVVAAGSWSSSQIMSYVQTAYDTWEVPPSFLLTVGDGPQLAPHYQSSTGTYGDNRYCCVDGSDYMADIYNGRFCSPTDFYPHIEEKQLDWQFDPLMDSDFWNTLLCAGMLQTYGGNTSARWFLYTCEVVHDTYEDIYGKTALRCYMTDATVDPPYYYRDDLPSHGGMVPSEITFDGVTEDVTNAVNDGVFLIQHRDHGSISGWSEPPYYTSDLNDLSNGDRTPMVMSFNCSTGNFYSNTSFAESFARMEGGAVMVYAAVNTSYSYFNDYVVYGSYCSFNDDFVSPPYSYTNPSGGYLAGQALLAGKLEMQTAAPYNPYGSWQGYAEKTWDLFLVFGDPTMDMRTAVPEALSVTAPGNLPAGSTEATFQVSMPGEDVVEGALVCLRKEDEEVWVSGVTDASGSVTLTFDPIASATEMEWMVTAHNALPEEGVINGVGVAGGTGAVIGRVGTPFPNPSLGSVTFPVTMGGTGDFDLTVYDLSGRSVATVHSGELAAGSHQLVWDGTSGGAPAPAGVYLARFGGPGGASGTFTVVLTR